MFRVSKFFSSFAKRSPFQAGREAAQAAMKNPGGKGTVTTGNVGLMWYARSAELYARSGGSYLYKGKPLTLFWKLPVLKELGEGEKPFYMQRQEFREMMRAANEDPDSYQDSDVEEFMLGYKEGYLAFMRDTKVGPYGEKDADGGRDANEDPDSDQDSDVEEFMLAYKEEYLDTKVDPYDEKDAATFVGNTVDGGRDAASAVVRKTVEGEEETAATIVGNTGEKDAAVAVVGKTVDGE